MKCFYCSNESDPDVPGKCSGCDRDLKKYCESCEIKFAGDANFCMQCGSKLIGLSEAEIEIEEESEEEVFILEEISEEEKKETVNDDTDDGIVELDFGIESNEDENEEKEQFQTQKIELDGSVPPPGIGVDADLDLDLEKKTKGKIDEALLKEPEGNVENSQGFVSPNAPKQPQKKKKKVAKPLDIKETYKGKPVEEDEKKEDVDLDTLFDELSTVEKLRIEDDDQYDVDDKKGGQKLSEIIEDSSDGKDEVNINLKSEKILVKNASDYELKPFPVDETYDVSVDNLIEEVVTGEFEESFKPLMKDMEKRFKECRGGTYFLKGDAGSGKSSLVHRLKNYSLQKDKGKNFNLVVTDANIFDFDFMIFISLIRQLMKIKSNDVNNVRKKFDKLFGDTLPDSKKDCISALICLNFAPVKTKLPKHDIEYLLSYVLHGLSRSMPVIWVINNANALNVRSIRFFKSLKKVFKTTPFGVVFVVDNEAAVTNIAEESEIFIFNGFPEQRLQEEIARTLNTKRIPAELEKLLKEKAKGNMLFTLQLTEYLKDQGFIFEMKGSWRFSKLPEKFVPPENLDDLIAARVEMLSSEVQTTLRELTLLNLYEIPKSLYEVVSSTSPECLQELVVKKFIIETDMHYRFISRTMLTALKKHVKIGKKEREFYRQVVTRLSATKAEIYQLNKHWLLLSYINLGQIIDRRLNSFLFSSAVYMEKLGFFEISQRSYQTIVSSFDDDDSLDDFRLLPEIKNARLWRIVEPQWAKIFWEKLHKYAKSRSHYHLDLLTQGEILLLSEENIDLAAIAEQVKKLHMAGCYEEEISLIDRTTELLINSENYLDANTFAVRGYKILRDTIVKYDGKGVSPAGFIYALFVRCSCKLAEVCIMLEDHDKATAVLEEALEYADIYSISYFKSKIQLLLGKIRFAQKSDWEDMMKEGFYNALIGMDFAIVKAFLHFFEENALEEKDWVQPFLEYKNWINF